MGTESYERAMSLDNVWYMCILRAEDSRYGCKSTRLVDVDNIKLFAFSI